MEWRTGRTVISHHAMAMIGNLFEEKLITFDNDAMVMLSNIFE